MATFTPLRHGRYIIHQQGKSLPAIETWVQERRYDGTIITRTSHESPDTHSTLRVESHASPRGRIYHAKIEWESGLRVAIQKATALYYATTQQLLVSRVLNGREFNDQQVTVTENFIFNPLSYVFLGFNLPKAAALRTTSVLVPTMSDIATNTNLLSPAFEMWSARLGGIATISRTSGEDEIAHYLYKSEHMAEEATIMIRSSDGVMISYEGDGTLVHLDSDNG